MYDLISWARANIWSTLHRMALLLITLTLTFPPSFITFIHVDTEGGLVGDIFYSFFVACCSFYFLLFSFFISFSFLAGYLYTS